MRISTSQWAERFYRLIDAGWEPHRELDVQYSSLDDAIADAIAWVEPITESNHPAALMGVEVSTTQGGWRTCSTSTSAPSVADRLKQLKGLHADGLIDDATFAAKRDAILVEL